MAIRNAYRNIPAPIPNPEAPSSTGQVRTSKRESRNPKQARMIRHSHVPTSWHGSSTCAARAGRPALYKTYRPDSRNRYRQKGKKPGRIGRARPAPPPAAERAAARRIPPFDTVGPIHLALRQAPVNALRPSTSPGQAVGPSTGSGQVTGTPHSALRTSHFALRTSHFPMTPPP